MRQSNQLKANVLLLDNNPASLWSIREILKDLDHNLVEVMAGEDALGLLREQEFAVAIIGVHSSDIVFRQAAEMICGSQDHCTPIVILSESDNSAFTMDHAYSLGAVDFLATPSPPGVVRSKVNAFADLYKRSNRWRFQAERTRQLEGQLRTSQDEVNDFFENATICLHIVAGDGTILQANQAELRLLGYKPEEYIGQPITAFHVDEFTISHILQQLQAGHFLSEYPARLRCKDGSVKEVLIDSSAKFVEGSLIHTRCFTRDVTDRNRANKELQKNEARWNSTVGLLPELMWTASSTGEANWVSEQWEHHTGIPVSDLLGLNWLEMVIHPEDVKNTIETIQAAVEKDAAFLLEHRIRRHDGVYIWFRTRGVPVRDENNNTIYWLGTSDDIETFKDTEAKLTEADRRKDEFLAVLAHELRNALSPVRTSMDILRVPGVDAETVEDAYQMIERQVEHLVRLVDDLLDASRIVQGKIELRKEIVDLSTVVYQAIEWVKPMMTSLSQQLSVRMPKEPLLVDADPVRLTQIVINLLNNACKYTNSQGKIEVFLTRRNDNSVLTIRDNGIGIPREMLTRIFDLFQQVEQSGLRQLSGLGIGLTIVKRIAKLHGGLIVATSDGEGKGSEFEVQLPLAQLLPHRIPECGHAQERRVRSPTSTKILVVDDNDDVAFSLSTLLRLQGHEVVVASNGLTALQLLNSYQPHIAFVDIRMPHLNGFELARYIRKSANAAAIKLIAITGGGHPSDFQNALESGFDLHLLKPITLENVTQVLDETPHLPGPAHT